MAVVRKLPTYLLSSVVIFTYPGCLVGLRAWSRRRAPCKEVESQPGQVGHSKRLARLPTHPYYIYMDVDDQGLEALFDGLLPQDLETFTASAFDENHMMAAGNDDKTSSRTRECWGGVLMGSAASCTPDADDGGSTRHHFKTHFCTSCKRDGIALNFELVRLIPEGQLHWFAHRSTRGFWASMVLPSSSGDTDRTIEYRVVNQTAKCRGSPMILFRGASDAEKLGLPRVPREQVVLDESGRIKFKLALGTLMPCRPPGAHLASTVVAPPDALLVAPTPPSRRCGSSSSSSSSRRRGSRSRSSNGSDVAEHSINGGGSSILDSTDSMDDAASVSDRPPLPDWRGMAACHGRLAAQLQDVAVQVTANEGATLAVRQYAELLLRVAQPVIQAAAALAPPSASSAGASSPTAPALAPAPPPNPPAPMPAPSPPMSPPDGAMARPEKVAAALPLARVRIHPLLMHFTCDVTELRLNTATATATLHADLLFTTMALSMATPAFISLTSKCTPLGAVMISWLSTMCVRIAGLIWACQAGVRASKQPGVVDDSLPLLTLRRHRVVALGTLVMECAFICLVRSRLALAFATSLWTSLEESSAQPSLGALACGGLAHLSQQDVDTWRFGSSHYAELPAFSLNRDGGAGFICHLPWLLLARIPYPTALLLMLLRVGMFEMIPPVSSDAASERFSRITRLLSTAAFTYVVEFYFRQNHLKKSTARLKASAIGPTIDPPPSLPCAEDATAKLRELPRAEESLASSRALAVVRMARDAAHASLARDWQRQTPEERGAAIQRGALYSISWALILVLSLSIRMIRHISNDANFLPRLYSNDIFQDHMYLTGTGSVLGCSMSFMYLLWRGWLHQQRVSSRLLAINDAFICTYNLVDSLDHFFRCYDMLGLSSSSIMRQRIRLELTEDLLCEGKSCSTKMLLIPWYLWMHGVDLRGRLQLGTVLLAATLLCEGSLEELKAGSMELAAGTGAMPLWASIVWGNAFAALFDVGRHRTN